MCVPVSGRQPKDDTPLKNDTLPHYWNDLSIQYIFLVEVFYTLRLGITLLVSQLTRLSLGRLVESVVVVNRGPWSSLLQTSQYQFLTV